MIPATYLTGLRWSTIFLSALALSIGWGIRGNFGHEYGAMIPGALAGIVVCLLSGRADWRERVAYFGFFGAVGWAFGGSMSYGQVLGFVHSAHAPTQYYGFFCLFIIGFLWGGIGGAGTAFPAVAPRDRMTEVFRPLVWILVVWFLLDYVALPAFETWESSYAQTWRRQASALYWFDADWFAAVSALVALGLYDLWDRRFRGAGLLLLLVCGGAALGCTLQALSDVTHLSDVLAWLFVWPQVDASRLPALAEAQGTTVEAVKATLTYNWPNFLVRNPQHVGWLFGAILGAILYFRKQGRFSGGTIFVYMATGWMLGFLLGPVLFNFGGAGLRMTPPRGDDWAGIVGLYIALLVWLRRNGMLPAAYASLVTAAFGGLGFAGAAFIKLLALRLGNPNVETDAALIEAWKHWQSANWHSVLEQTYGFINGIGLAIAMGLLARRKGHVLPGHVARPWTETFSVAFVLFVVGWLNIYKNVPEWVEHVKNVPATMKAPLFGAVELSADAWFGIAFVAIGLCTVALMSRHRREPIAMLPNTALGKGQLFFLVTLWVFVIANFERAMPGFTEQRLITEWVILLNAALATWLILTLPRNVEVTVGELGQMDYARPLRNAWWGVAIALVLSSMVFPAAVRSLYEGKGAGHAGKDIRFGPDATWRVRPLQIGLDHK